VVSATQGRGRGARSLRWGEAERGSPRSARKGEGLDAAAVQAPETAILVSELECRLPGCPPLETVIAFWENDKRHHFKLFKPVKEVVYDDLPFTWMKSELIVPDDFSCECC
jgi:hypothetical protein